MCVQYNTHVSTRGNKLYKVLPISVKHLSVTFLNRGTLRNCNKVATLQDTNILRQTGEYVTSITV